jgi:hypothetical protein
VSILRSPTKPFPYLAFPQFLTPGNALKCPGFDGELMASSVNAPTNDIAREEHRSGDRELQHHLESRLSRFLSTSHDLRSLIASSVAAIICGVVKARVDPPLLSTLSDFRQAAAWGSQFSAEAWRRSGCVGI